MDNILTNQRTFYPMRGCTNKNKIVSNQRTFKPMRGCHNMDKILTNRRTFNQLEGVKTKGNDSKTNQRMF